MFDNYNDHSDTACQDRHGSNSNVKRDLINLSAADDRFYNEILVVRAYELDPCVKMFEKAKKIHLGTLNIDDKFYRTDLYS